MIEIRIHGRGGQGGVTLAKVIATTRFLQGASVQAFGLYAVSGKVTAFAAPALIAVVTAATGSQRLGFSPVIALFLIGLLLLYWAKSEYEQPGDLPA